MEQPKLQTHALSVELLSQVELVCRHAACATNLKYCQNTFSDSWDIFVSHENGKKEEFSLIQFNWIATTLSSQWIECDLTDAQAEW